MGAKLKGKQGGAAHCDWFPYRPRFRPFDTTLDPIVCLFSTCRAYSNENYVNKTWVLRKRFAKTNFTTKEF